MAEKGEMKDSQIRCAFFLPAKKRCCKMLVVKGSKYCGQHQEENSTRKRVPCPLDPSHNVYEDQLGKHLHKCNARPKPKPVYYSERINSGLVDYVPCKEEMQPLAEFPAPLVEEITQRVAAAYTRHVGVMEEKCLTHQVMQSSLHDPSNGTTALKHLKQQASILGHLDKTRLLTPGTCFVEFGAGRGKLSHWIQLATNGDHGNQYVLVDRANCRRKMDVYHKPDSGVASFTRLLMDIEHLNLGQLECAKSCRNVVGVSKHLCGAATDLAIRCLCSTIPTVTEAKPLPSCHHDSHSLEEPSSSIPPLGSALGKRPGVDDCSVQALEENKKPKVFDHLLPNKFGLAMASCCHHRCNWASYVGQPFMEQLGFGPAEFHLLTLMSSWAVCGMKTNVSSNDGDDTHSNCRGYIPHPKESIGLQCKRLIDAGRVWYLRQKGLEAEQCHYVDKKVSLENNLIIATHQSDQ